MSVKSAEIDTWVLVVQGFDPYGIKGFPDKGYREKIDIGDEQHHMRLYDGAIEAYTTVVGMKQCRMNDFARCEALLKRAKSYSSYASVLKMIPAIMSERTAVYAPEPSSLARKAVQDADKAEVYLRSALASVLEIKGDAMESMENFEEALKMFTKCQEFDDSERVRVKIARNSERVGSVNKTRQANDQADTNGQPSREITRADDLDCTLCLKLLYEPITTPCGHTFCRPCFLRSKDHNVHCPMCRRVLHTGDNVPVNRVLSNVLQRCFASEYEERKLEEASFSLTQNPEGEDAILPLFVMSPLLPGEKMALNIFEPRYRLMIRRVMEGNKKFGMATVNEDHQLSHTACEAEILECEALPDGRYTLEIIGTRRFAPRNATELDGYRIANFEYIGDDHVEENTPEYDELMSSAEKVQRLTNTWLERLRRLADSRNSANNFLQDLADNPGFGDMEKFSFWATSTLVPVMQGLGSGVKSQMLETRRTKERLDLCISLLEQFQQVQMESCTIS